MDKVYNNAAQCLLTFSNTDVEFNVRPLHVLMMSSTNWLSAHIVPVIDTMATFTSSTRNKANAFSIKKNVDVSWIKQGSNCSHISMFYKRNTNGLDLRSDGLLGYRPLEWWLTSLSGWKLFVLSRVNDVFWLPDLFLVWPVLSRVGESYSEMMFRIFSNVYAYC
jgi:hypothetical protein